MIEIGGDFDDSLFGESKPKSTGAGLSSYNAKTCPPEWFSAVSDLSEIDPAERHNFWKCRADHDFFVGDYGHALISYDKSLECLQPNNVTMWRDIQESKARSYIGLGNSGSALQIAQEMLINSSNYEQKSASLSLVCDLFRKCNNTQEELKSLQLLLVLHSSNANLWMQLADAYSRLYNRTPLNTEPKAKEKVNSTPEADGNNSETSSMKDINTIVLTCLHRARQLLKSVQNTISSFAKETNLRHLEKVEKEIDSLKVHEDIHHKCKQFLFKMRATEEETSTDDLSKLQYLKDTNISTFENKWFTWNKEM